MKRLVLIDAHAVIHRAYHALPPLTTPGGEPINAVYGFTSILMRILRELKPDYLAAAFDLPGPTFRHIAYERYKAQRPETPSDLSSQFSKTKEILDAFGICSFEKESYEADDILATISRKLEKNKKIEIIIVTGDMDALQLVRSGLKVYSMKKGISDTIIYDEKMVYERYGFKPSQVIDFKGLKGDPSDNIPGVKGIGEKTATELIKKFSSIEGIYKTLKKTKGDLVKLKKIGISPTIYEKLKAGEEDAQFSRELARMKADVPIEFRLEDTAWREGLAVEKSKNIFLRFGFTSLLKRLEEQDKKPKFVAPTLFTNMASASFKPNEISSEADFENFKKKNSDSSLGLIVYDEKLFTISKKDTSVFFFNNFFINKGSFKNFFEKRDDFFVYDLKSVCSFFFARKISLGGAQFDIKLAAYLAGVFIRDFSYLAIVSRELGRMVSPDPREEFLHFFEIVESLETKLSEGKLAFILRNIELPLSRILVQIEKRGILIDREFLAKLAERVDKKISSLAQEIYDLAGEQFNINSSQQLSKVIFEKLGIKNYGLRKTEKGRVTSTSASELEKLKNAHPVIIKILGYRELAKLKTTYIDVLPKLVDLTTGRLHTTFNQTGTATGRLSSSDPNLQNIPIMSPTGREIRRAFVAEKGYLLVSFDYSQIELRVAAHLASDQKMIEAFRRGVDIHALTASEVYNTPLEKVTSDLRRAAKTLNFGILYGMGPQALSESTGMSREEAKKFIDEYFHDFAGIRDYIEQTKRFAEENGYVETLFGRRRYIPEINSSNWQMKREAERMAVNFPIQGSATGDIIKMAMIGVDAWIRRKKLEDEVRMLLQVHDELLFEIKNELVKDTIPQIKNIMESVAELKVPLIVDVKIGKNWGEQ